MSIFLFYFIYLFIYLLKKLFFSLPKHILYDCKRPVNGTYIPLSSFYDRNFGRFNLYRRIYGGTDRRMKTKGPILVTSPCVASFSLDLEWSDTRTRDYNLIVTVLFLNSSLIFSCGFKSLFQNVESFSFF